MIIAAAPFLADGDYSKYLAINNRCYRYGGDCNYGRTDVHDCFDVAADVDGQPVDQPVHADIRDPDAAEHALQG